MKIDRYGGSTHRAGASAEKLRTEAVVSLGGHFDHCQHVPWLRVRERLVINQRGIKIKAELVGKRHGVYSFRKEPSL